MTKYGGKRVLQGPHKDHPKGPKSRKSRSKVGPKTRSRYLPEKVMILIPLDPSKQCSRCSGSQVFTFSGGSKKVSKMVRKRSPKGGQVHQKASPDGAPENDQKSHQKIVENVSPRHPQKGAEIHKKGDGKLQKKRWFSQWRPKGGQGPFWIDFWWFRSIFWTHLGVHFKGLRNIFHIVLVSCSIHFFGTILADKGDKGR